MVEARPDVIWPCRPCCLLVFLGAASAPGLAQQQREPDSFLNQQRAVEERLRSQFDTQMGAVGRTSFDWGGWYSFHGFLFDDGQNSSRTLRRHDLRLWGRLVLENGAHEFYARGRTSLLDFNSGDSYDGNDDDVEGPNLERGYYRFDLARALRAYEERDIGYNLVATVGRDLVQFGTGLTLASPLDHVSLRGTWGGLELTGLAGRTVGSMEDFDFSRTATRTKRDFFGGELTYHGFERHGPFAYALWQRDRNSERSRQRAQGFDYDSFYAGLGSRGELIEHLRYSAELVYETGYGFSSGESRHRNDIEAWGFDAQLEYLSPGRGKARASIEYLFGSGDADRSGSPTSTVGGNDGDFKDEGFIGFGYRDTGLSFAPRYSNLHMWRMGASLYPWPHRDALRRMELGTDWYLFYKHHRAGAVSDPTADRRSGYLGWEMDYFANWRVTVDLAWTARFGVFFPGDAFSDRGTRTFLLLGMTWSF